MILYEAVYAEAKRERGSLAFVLVLSGVANLALMLAIQSAASSASSRGIGSFVAFIVHGTAYVFGVRSVNRRITSLIETVLHRIKIRVGQRLVAAELSAMEQANAAEICDRLTENLALISERAGVIASLVQAIFFMLFALRYVGTLSIAVMLLLVVCGGLGLALFISIRRDFVTLSQRSDSMRVRFVESLADLLSGFKEVTLSSQRSREVRQEIIESSLVMRETSVRSSNLISDGALVAEGALFAVLAAVVCVLKFYSHVDTSTLTNVVAMIILMWGPFQKIAAGIVPFMRSNLALEEIDKLERALEFATTVPIASTQDPWQGRVSTIEARGIEYSYTVEKGGETFRVGPIDLTIRSGEIIFIVGGNGSGKSTLLKVLTGLYLPQAGELRVNGAVVSTDNVTAYRELVSAVFADFHLFQKLYGLPDVDPAEARELLQRMELEDKTAIVDRTFTNTKLSTGQKKRLAMVVALLEARPICVFDEWAADQAPEFRRTFYEDLLPSLRRRGRAIVVISHDDRYFHLADHVVTMETGRIREIKNRIPVDEVESADRATA